MSLTKATIRPAMPLARVGEGQRARGGYPFDVRPHGIELAAEGAR
jgi:hypothetical protein